MIAVALSMAIMWPTWPEVLLAVVALATQHHALFILSHEAAHYRLFEQRWLNDAVGCLCAGLVCFSMRSYRVIHRLHHSHLYGRLDPDIALHGGYPGSKAYLV